MNRKQLTIAEGFLLIQLEEMKSATLFLAQTSTPASVGSEYSVDGERHGAPEATQSAPITSDQAAETTEGRYGLDETGHEQRARSSTEVEYCFSERERGLRGAAALASELVHF
jgi:hypothetical protein